MKRLLMISKLQFGYNTDYLNYCRFLTKEYEITFLCFDSHLEKITLPHVTVQYMAYRAGIHSKLMLLKHSMRLISELKPDLIFVSYFPGCGILGRLYGRRKLCLDIRSATIDKDPEVCARKDKVMSLDARCFRNISVISEGLIQRLKLPPDRTTVIPLGADQVIPEKKPEPGKLHLLYVGTFDERRIEDTIRGFRLFFERYGEEADCRYTIIGFSLNGHEKVLRQVIEEENMTGCIDLLGRKRPDELWPYFQSHQVGVSYVPITDYFQHQPPTKTFEYIRNGLICLATNTVENARIIGKENGVLIEEGPESFFRGLEKIFLNLSDYNPTRIMEASSSYSWRNIIEGTLIPYLERMH